MKIVYIGSVKFSEFFLNKLIDINYPPIGVCTLEKSDFNSDHVDLREICSHYNIPSRYTPNVNSKENIKWIKSLNPDIIFCFGWSKLLKEELLNLPKYGVVGYHPAALPKNRGRHPLIWSLVLGLSKTASTFFFMEKGADSGDIISQQTVPISSDEDAKSLYYKMAKTAMRQIEKFVPEIEMGKNNRFAQNHSLANTWRLRNEQDGKIDWRMSSKAIHNLVRG